MTTPNFEPWKPTGNDPRFRGLRLLILGESHYDEGESYSAEEQRLFTQDIVKRWGAEAEGYQRFFSNVFHTFNESDANHRSPDFSQFWNSVFFYNYIQELVVGQARARPANAAWASSADAFHAVLSDIKPEAIVVVGRTTWNKMSDRGAEPVLTDEEALGSIWRYPYDGGSCYVAHTHHPSKTGYSASYWRPRVKRFLDWALTDGVPSQ